MKEAFVLIVAYFLGAIPFGLIVGKVIKGIDIREFGSGNIGATNVLRTLGTGPAALVFIFDTLKGVASAVVATLLVAPPYTPIFVVVAGILAIVGHTASPFLRFRGGKGVATSLGVIIGMNWLIALISFAIWGIIVLLFRYISLASIIASASTPVLMFLAPKIIGKPIPLEYRIFTIAAAALILVKHRSNLVRLKKGVEPRIGGRVKID